MMTLRAVLGDYPNTAALRHGAIGAPGLAFEFAEVALAQHAFKDVVREQRYDVAELALVTFLQARAHGRPLVLLPAVVRGGFHHGTLVSDAARGVLEPSDLHGRRVAIRATSVTTVAWVRAILQNDHGVDLDRVQWVRVEDPHVAEYREPANCERAPEGATLKGMLLAGDVDAAVLTGDALADPRLRPVIGNPAAAAAAWHARHRCVPINHMVVATEALARQSPEAVARVFGLLWESRRRAVPAPGGDGDPYPFGLERCRPALELAIDLAVQQRLIPGRLAVDDLFDDRTRALAP